MSNGAWSLTEVERAVIQQLNPPLNIVGLRRADRALLQDARKITADQHVHGASPPTPARTAARSQIVLQAPALVFTAAALGYGDETAGHHRLAAGEA